MREKLRLIISFPLSILVTVAFTCRIEHSIAFLPRHVQRRRQRQGNLYYQGGKESRHIPSAELKQEVIIDQAKISSTESLLANTNNERISTSTPSLLEVPALDTSFTDLRSELQRYFTTDEISCLLSTIDALSEGETTKSVMLDFLVFLLQTGEQTEQQNGMGNAFATMDVMLGAAVHVADNVGVNQIDDWQICQFSDATRKISGGASKIERAEILVRRYIGAHRIISKEEASRVHGLLLSVMDDWRSLAIRCAACLYRLQLQGTRLQQASNVAMLQRTQPLHRAAKEALRVYAPMAQQLGMHKLKELIQDYAFGIAYPRQYSAAHGLYQGNLPVVNALKRYLENHISTTIQTNQILMHQLEHFQITSRVKKPYSSWAKLLKSRFKRGSSTKQSIQLSGEPAADDLSLSQINDVVALRVVLKARKLDPDEPPEVTRYRERLLCYLVQEFIQQDWPEIKSRKDYIDNPKGNGYQSLHFTASISQGIHEWPFEVQVRSEEMHQNAEYGLAAHWNYKLNPGKQPLALLGDSPLGIYQPRKSYIDALVFRKQEIASVSFVFVAVVDNGESRDQGQLVCVPHGGRVQDVLRTAHILSNDHGDDDATETSFVSVSRNGSSTSLDDVVVNGDVLLVDQSRRRTAQLLLAG